MFLLVQSNSFLGNSAEQQTMISQRDDFSMLFVKSDINVKGNSIYLKVFYVYCISIKDAENKLCKL